MPAIKHYFIIRAEKNRVYNAITTQEGISSWWTKENKIEPVIGSTAVFDFGEKYHNRMKILDLVEDKLVHWECFEGDEKWIGTKLKFELDQHGDNTAVRFSHYNWKKESDFYASCNYHWGYYLRSIKLYCETGKGTPFNSEQ